MADKWNMIDEQLIEILRGLGNATRKMHRNYDRTIYDVAADRIERLRIGELIDEHSDSEGGNR